MFRSLAQTPLPTTYLSQQERCRICSVYRRPWVLSAKYASAHVPLLADLDILVSDVISALQSQGEVKGEYNKEDALTLEATEL